MFTKLFTKLFRHCLLKAIPNQFPLILNHLHLSDFGKWGLFGKLIPWGVRRNKIFGSPPHKNSKSSPFSPLKGGVSLKIFFLHLWSDFDKNLVYYVKLQKNAIGVEFFMIRPIVFEILTFLWRKIDFLPKIPQFFGTLSGKCIEARNNLKAVSESL